MLISIDVAKGSLLMFSPINSSIYLGYHFHTVQAISQGVVVRVADFFIWGFTKLSTHITTDSFVGRGNQYIQLVKVLHCKLPTIGKQLPTFPHKANVLPLSHRG